MTEFTNKTKSTSVHNNKRRFLPFLFAVNESLHVVTVRCAPPELTK